MTIDFCKDKILSQWNRAYKVNQIDIKDKYTLCMYYVNVDVQ